MLTTMIIQTTIALIISIILLATTQRLRCTRVFYTEPAPLQDGMIKARLALTIRLFISAMVVLMPLILLSIHFNLSWITILTLAVLSFVFSFIFSPKLRISPHSKFVITKSILSNTAILHLKTPYQNVDHETYLELLCLIKSLPKHGVKKIKIHSPIFFFSKTDLREIRLFKNHLNKKNITLNFIPTNKFYSLKEKINILTFRKSSGRINPIKMSKHCSYTLSIDLV